MKNFIEINEIDIKENCLRGNSLILIKIIK